MFCKKCGKQLPDHVAFCTACGTPVVKLVAPVSPAPAEPVVPEPVTVAEVMAQPPVVQQPEEPVVVENCVTPVEDIPAEEAPVEEVPAEETLAEEVPAEEPVVEMLPVMTEPESAEAPETVYPVEQSEPQIAEPIYPAVETLVTPVPESEPVAQSAPAAPVATVNYCEPKAAPVKKVKTRKKRPHIALRAFMQLLSFVLCVILMVTLLAGVLLLDLRKLTSSEGLETIINALLVGTDSREEPEAAFVPVAPAGPTVMPMADIDINVDDIPTDILTGGNSEENMDALIDWLYEEIQKNSKEEVKFTSEDLQNFMENSTVSDFVSEKLAGFAEDFVNGTENTEITADELMDLLEENEKALEKELNIKLTEKDKQKLNDTLVEVVEEKKLNETIREKVNTTMDEVLQESLGVELETVQNLIRQLTSDGVLYIVLGLCLLLVILLCALNYYNVAAGLSWSAAAGIADGLLLSLPVLLIHYSADVVVGLVPEAASIMGVMKSVVAPIAPYHYWLLIGSLVLFVVTIVWRIIARSIRKRPVAA